MKLLAWDTSSKGGTLVAMEWDADAVDARSTLRLMGEWALPLAATHSEQLLWAIHQMLQSARWKIEDIDVFGVGLGPGSFTGLRIGVTTARTLAHTLNKPVVGVSSLAALLRPYADAAASFGESVLAVAVTEACKGEVYSLYGLCKGVSQVVVRAQGDASGIWAKGVEEGVWTPEELAERLSKKLPEGSSWFVVGDARDRYLEIIEKLPAKSRVELLWGLPDRIQGRALGQLVWEGIQAGVQRPALKIVPNYLRASDAEIKLAAKRAMAAG